MLNIKINKAKTQDSIKENLKALATVINQMQQPELEPEKWDILKIQKELIKQNIALIIEAAFRGNEPEKSTKFDLQTDLMQELKPYFKKKIGDKRESEIESIIGKYFVPEAVDDLSIKCYISMYYNHFDFVYTKNGYTYGNNSDIVSISFDDHYQHRAEYPLDLENLFTTYRFDESYIGLNMIENTAINIYHQQKESVKKFKQLMEEANKLIENSHNQVPYQVRVLKNFVSVSHFMTNRLKTIDY